MAEDNQMIEKVEQIAGRGSEYIPSREGSRLSSAERAEELWGLFSEYSNFRRGLLRQGLRASREGGGVPLPKEERETPTFAELSKEQRAEERSKIEVQLSQNPLVLRLEGEIGYLWQDPAVRRIFTSRVRESIRQRETHAPVLKRYREFQRQAVDAEEEYFDLLRNQFLMRQITPTLRAIDIDRNRVTREELQRSLTDLETKGGMNPEAREKRGGLDNEHADVTALLSYERIRSFHNQFRTIGIILTPSRQQLLDDVVDKTAKGTWILLKGEMGTGKTTFASATSEILNGEPPQLAGGDKYGDVKALVGTRTMDGSKVYYDFGPLTAALTGCANSIEMEEVIRENRDVPGKLLVVDEITKFDQDALYGALKLVGSIRRRPGSTFSFKELPGVTLRMAKRGVALIATMNPVSDRYEGRKLVGPLERLFYDGMKEVDYLPMTTEQPELYEAFLGILMDDNGRIRIPGKDLAPAFTEGTDLAGKKKIEIASDIKKHGALFRFALAAAETHKSYSRKDSVAKTPTDEGFLQRFVLDTDVLVEWIGGYGSHIEGGDSLATYLEKKLHDFYINIDDQNDQAVFKRIFDHFGFNIENPRQIPKANYLPLTPIEIGYLTPKTPRAVKQVGGEIIPETLLYTDLETGEDINYRAEAIKDESGEYINSGEVIRRDGKGYVYLGIDAATGETIFIPPQEGTTIAGSTLPQEAAKSADQMVERAKNILGKDFLGVEAVRAMEAKLKAKGVNAEFSLDIPLLPYSGKDLELAKQNGEMLVLRPNGMKVNGAHTDLTIMNFRQLFDQDPIGSGTHAIYPNTWHSGKTFAEGPAVINAQWALVKKEILTGSTSKKYVDQDGLLVTYGDELRKKGANNTTVKRRTAFEVMWDTMLYYTNTGEKLLPNVYDWTQTQASDDYLVCVGGFDSGGLGVGGRDPSGPYPDIGVCPSR